MTLNHSPILLHIMGSMQSSPKSFRFEKFLTHDPASRLTVHNASIHRGSPTSQLSQKLAAMKLALKHWNKESFGLIQERIHSLQSSIDYIQQLPISDQSKDAEQRVQCNLQEELRKEDILWKSKSCVQWLTSPDLNTKFFHASTIIWRRRNNIEALKERTGNWHYARDDIGSLFPDHFQSLYSSLDPMLSNELAEIIAPSISEEEN